MNVLVFQIFIVATLWFTHIVNRKAVFIVCILWTLETLLLLHVSWVIVVQLCVIWGTWLFFSKLTRSPELTITKEAPNVVLAFIFKALKATILLVIIGLVIYIFTYTSEKYESPIKNITYEGSNFKSVPKKITNHNVATKLTTNNEKLREPLNREKAKAKAKARYTNDDDLYYDDTSLYFHTLEHKANQGDSESQRILGDMYLTGSGVTKDYEQAYNWYKEAARQDNAAAQFNLGVMYGNGWFVKKNIKKMNNLFNKSATLGYSPAINAVTK